MRGREEINWEEGERERSSGKNRDRREGGG